MTITILKSIKFDSLLIVKRLIFIPLALALIWPAGAQDAGTDPQTAREEAELRVESEMVQLNSMVEALAMNLGQLHYLRGLCYTKSDQKWRTYASQMIEVETPDDGERRSNLIQAFNKGYYLEEARHSECSQKVALDVAALAENGRQLAGMLGNPYRED